MFTRQGTQGCVDFECCRPGTKVNKRYQLNILMESSSGWMGQNKCVTVFNLLLSYRELMPLSYNHDHDLFLTSTKWTVCGCRSQWDLVGIKSEHNRSTPAWVKGAFQRSCSLLIVTIFVKL